MPLKLKEELFFSANEECDEDPTDSLELETGLDSELMELVQVHGSKLYNFNAKILECLVYNVHYLPSRWKSIAFDIDLELSVEVFMRIEVAQKYTEREKLPFELALDRINENRLNRNIGGLTWGHIITALSPRYTNICRIVLTEFKRVFWEIEHRSLPQPSSLSWPQSENDVSFPSNHYKEPVEHEESLNDTNTSPNLSNEARFNPSAPSPSTDMFSFSGCANVLYSPANSEHDVRGSADSLSHLFPPLTVDLSTATTKQAAVVEAKNVGAVTFGACSLPPSGSETSSIKVLLTDSEDGKSYSQKLHLYLKSKRVLVYTHGMLEEYCERGYAEKINLIYNEVDFVIPVLTPGYLSDIRPVGAMVSSNSAAVRYLYTHYTEGVLWQASVNMKVRPYLTPLVTFTDLRMQTHLPSFLKSTCNDIKMLYKILVQSKRRSTG